MTFLVELVIIPSFIASGFIVLPFLIEETVEILLSSIFDFLLMCVLHRVHCVHCFGIHGLEFFEDGLLM